MALTCNIDARGQRARRVWGILNLAAALLAAVLAFHAAIWWLWLVAGAMVVGGLFALWEARRKWCAVRAMGIKTPV